MKTNNKSVKMEEKKIQDEIKKKKGSSLEKSSSLPLLNAILNCNIASCEPMEFLLR